MAKVSISEAARLAGIARSNFYTTYINKGRISVSRNSNGKKFIETSELLRVFPDIRQDNKTGQQGRVTGQNRTVENKPDNSAELEQLRQQLRETKESSQRLCDEFLEREQWYRQQIEKQDDKIKLLEHQQLDQLLRVKWWQFWK